MKRIRQIEMFLYGLSDYLMATIAWVLFFLYRKHLEGKSIDASVWQDKNLWLGAIIIPIGWILYYSFFDKYRDIYRLSRLTTLARTFFLTFFGVVFIFFTLILDDFVNDYHTYYVSILALFGLHFILTASARMIILTRASRRLKKGLITYNTLIIGGDNSAKDLYEEVKNHEKGLGNNFIGFIDTNGDSIKPLQKYLPKLGSIAALPTLIEQHNIEEVIIATETHENPKINAILNSLFDYGDQILIKIIPDMYDILLGNVKMNHVYSAILIEIKQDLMPLWQQVLKRIMDLSISIVLLAILSPLFLYIAIRVKLSSEGSIFFRQERIGIHGKPFTLIKFRSMATDAEKTGPQLSKENDPRCTPWGAIMRKWRLDELPNFLNVIKGDMSLVGPRPERQFYIDKISAREPHYRNLLKVRPGITSWGQVKYGYASNVDEMVQRMRFDILYIENMSIALDLKILFYTALVLLQGKGK